MKKVILESFKESFKDCREEETERWMAENKDVRKHKSRLLIFSALLWR